MQFQKNLGNLVQRHFQINKSKIDNEVFAVILKCSDKRWPNIYCADKVAFLLIITHLYIFWTVALVFLRKHRRQFKAKDDENRASFKQTYRMRVKFSSESYFLLRTLSRNDFFVCCEYIIPIKYYYILQWLFEMYFTALFFSRRWTTISRFLPSEF